MANDNSSKFAPSRSQTVHLRVYVHCEGCKKKVKKILGKIDGVYAVDIDASVGKVTVTGTVDASTLMRNLEKAHKVAELWPSTAEALPVQALKGKEDEGNGDLKKGKTSPVNVKEQQLKQQRDQDKADEKTEGSPQRSKASGGKNNGQEEVETASNQKKKASPAVAANAATASGKKKAEDKGEKMEEATKKKTDMNESGGGGEGNDGKNGEKKAGQKGRSNVEGDKMEDGKGTVIAAGIEKMEGCAAKEGGGGITKEDAGNGASPYPKGQHSSSSSSSSRICKKKEMQAVEENDNGDNICNGKGKEEEENSRDDEEEDDERRRANRHVAPPPMVLVETSPPAYTIAEMGSSVESYYGTHMFSDENANSCSLM